VIATILLVAIVVVLAAFLYVLVGGFAKGPSSAPLGSALALGPATSTSGTAATSPFCKAGHGCYSVSVASAASSLAIGDLQFALKTSAGTSQLVLKGSGMFSIVDTSGKIVAESPSVAKGQPLAATSWTFPTKGFTSSTPLTSLMTIWVEFGTGITSPAGNGFVLTAYGTGAFQGSITLALP